VDFDAHTVTIPNKAYFTPELPGGESVEKIMSEQEEIDLSSGIAAFEAKHFSRAMQLLKPLAENSNADAQYRVAIMYQNGLGVIPQPEAAYQWMRRAAEQGHALAQHGLGFMYMEGDCVQNNGTEAVKWFTLAAKQGLTGSQTTLAMMYEEGRGIERDLEKAKEWYTKAGFHS
jgi:TPR repeat protein